MNMLQLKLVDNSIILPEQIEIAFDIDRVLDGNCVYWMQKRLRSGTITYTIRHQVQHLPDHYTRYKATFSSIKTVNDVIAPVYTEEPRLLYAGSLNE